jgi:hypothetical protein
MWLKKLVAMVFGLMVLGRPCAAQQFYGEILLKPIDGVLMEVQQPFGFIDARKRKWEVPAKYRTDGASIPRALWSIIGSPFTGNYLAAAIVHDFYCDLKSRDWRDVHSAFFDAMIANKVDSVQAKVMYYAVYRFGPRWVVDKHFTCPPGVACQLAPGGKATHVREVNVTPVFDEAEFRREMLEIEAGTLSLSKIRSAADASFYREDQMFIVKGKVNAGGEEISIDQQARLKDVTALRGSLEHLLRSRD